MASNTPGVASNGAAPGQHAEKERTAEQLAAIHAAMMEELGIGRKDELPLEDRGHEHDPAISDLKAIKKRIVSTNSVSAAWQNIQFDDVDPADNELDPIADGQLYRLRREASQNVYQQNFRGRGGFAYRGGHASAGRGGAHNTRDMGRRMSPQPAFHSSTPQPFFNNARRALPGNARVDQFIANLRAEHDMANQRRKNKKRQQPDPSPSPSHHSPLAHLARPVQPSISRSSRHALQPALANFSLASGAQFLSHVEIDPNARVPSVAGAQPVPVIKGAPEASETSKTTTREPPCKSPNLVTTHMRQVKQNVDTGRTQPSLKVSTSQPVSSLEKLTVPTPDTLRQVNHPKEDGQKPLLEKQRVGLASSRYAQGASTSSEVAALSQQASPSPSRSNKKNENPFTGKTFVGLAASRWAAPASRLPNASRAIKREHGVIVRKDDDAGRPGQARLFKNTPEDQYFTLELEQDDKILVQEEVIDEVYFILESLVVTFQAAGRGHRSPVWRLQFRMPYMAKNFYETVRYQPAHRIRRAQPPVVAANSQLAPKNVHEASEAELQSTGNQANSMSPALAMPEQSSIPLATESVSGLRDSGNSMAALEPTGEPINEPAGASQHTNRPEKQNGAMVPGQTLELSPNKPIQFLVEFSSSNSPENQLKDAGNRISSQVFRELSELDGVAPLVSFSDNEDEVDDEPGSLPLALKDLLGKADTDAILSKLDGRSEGTFLQQLSAIVTPVGGPPAEELTAEELRNSDHARLYELASQTVVGEFLSDSEVFKKLPDFVSLVWVHDMSKKVFDKALVHREASRAVPRRTVFSVEELLSYRKHAYEVRAELFDKEDLPPIYKGKEPFRRNAVRASAVATASMHQVVSDEKVPKQTASTDPVAIPSAISKEPAPQPPARATPVANPPAVSNKITSSQKWQTFQAQQTDMAAWYAFFNTGKKAATSISEAKSKPETTQSPPTNPPRGAKHVPTNSDYDRLAQTLEGWHIDQELHEKQLSSESISSDTVDKATPVASTLEVHPPPRLSLSPSQSMTQKLTAALEEPPTASPLIKSHIATIHTRLHAIEGQLNPAGVTSGNAGSVLKANPFREPLPEYVSVPQNSIAQLHNGPAQGPSQGPATQQSIPQISTGSLQDRRAHGPVTAPVTAAQQPLLTPEAETPISTRSSPPTQLRRGVGLTASRWASGQSDFVTPEGDYSRSSTRSSHRIVSATAPVFQPSSQPLKTSSIRPHTLLQGIILPPPIIPTQPGFASNPLSPSGQRGRADAPANTASSRQALSPVHVQNSLQSQLQSRLNSSLAARQHSGPPARR